MYHANANVNLMTKNIIQRKFVIAINANATAKIQLKLCAKKAILGFLLNILVEMVDRQKSLLNIQ